AGKFSEPISDADASPSFFRYPAPSAYTFLLHARAFIFKNDLANDSSASITTCSSKKSDSFQLR
ncbi:MAG: hypothetical protein II242_05695, partial [Peptococcaceae bacterium]|nr:hypothetical protein [Peptococcaceae bacterium]